ncbi:hypothetical protein MTO96_021252 [Rhipicephalus appendiculatus]
MQKGCQWLPFAVREVQSYVAERECFRIRVVEAAQARNDSAFPFVVLLDQALRQLCEHLRLAVGRGLPKLQRPYVCFHHLRLTSRAGLCWSVLDIMEAAPPLLVKSPEFSFGSEAPGGLWLQETVQFLGCHYGFQPFKHLRGLGNICVLNAWVRAASVARLREDGQAAQ